MVDFVAKGGGELRHRPKLDGDVHRGVAKLDVDPKNIFW